MKYRICVHCLGKTKIGLPEELTTKFSDVIVSTDWNQFITFFEFSTQKNIPIKNSLIYLRVSTGYFSKSNFEKERTFLDNQSFYYTWGSFFILFNNTIEEL